MEVAEGYGVSSKVLHEFEDEGGKQIVIYETESGERWSVPLEVFMAHGWEHKFKGYELQRFLKEEWWKVQNADGSTKHEGKIYIPKEVAPVVEDKQLKLF